MIATTLGTRRLEAGDSTAMALTKQAEYVGSQLWWAAVMPLTRTIRQGSATIVLCAMGKGFGHVDADDPQKDQVGCILMIEKPFLRSFLNARKLVCTTQTLQKQPQVL